MSTPLVGVERCRNKRSTLAEQLLKILHRDHSCIDVLNFDLPLRQSSLDQAQSWFQLFLLLRLLAASTILRLTTFVLCHFRVLGLLEPLLQTVFAALLQAGSAIDLLPIGSSDGSRTLARLVVATHQRLLLLLQAVATSLQLGRALGSATSLATLLRLLLLFLLVGSLLADAALATPLYPLVTLASGALALALSLSATAAPAWKGSASAANASGLAADASKFLVPLDQLVQAVVLHVDVCHLWFAAKNIFV